MSSKKLPYNFTAVFVMGTFAILSVLISLHFGRSKIEQVASGPRVQVERIPAAEARELGISYRN